MPIRAARRLILPAAVAIAAALPAEARVASAGADHFTITLEALAAARPTEAFRQFVEISDWWSDAHTYGGDAGKLDLDARRGGCWCEDLGFQNGFVEHMRVVYVAPAKALRLVGGLGPLQEMAVSAAMTVRFEAVAGGTRVSLTYAAAGHAEGGLDALAPVVDAVLAEQLARYAEHTAGQFRY